MKKILLLTASLFAFICADEFVEDGTTSIGGYGELHYDMEANDGDGKLDFHRFWPSSIYSEGTRTFPRFRPGVYPHLSIKSD